MKSFFRTALASLSVCMLSACGGGGSSSTVSQTSAGFTVEGGLAQKGPLLKGSRVTIAELNPLNYAPSGLSYDLLTKDNKGGFTSSGINFTRQHIQTFAQGYYLNEITGAQANDSVLLQAQGDLTLDRLVNVNLLTTLAGPRIVALVTDPSKSAYYRNFAAARAQAQKEVLGAFRIYNGTDMMSGDTSLTTVTVPNNFNELDIAKDATPNKILVALSALVMQIGGNGVGISQFIANFQLDLTDDGLINGSAGSSALQTSINTASAAVNLTTVATKLNAFYALPLNLGALTSTTTFTAAQLTPWVDSSGGVDLVVDKFKSTSTTAVAGTVSKSVAYTAGSDDAGTCFSVGSVTTGATGALYINGSATGVTAPALVTKGQSVVLGLTASAAGTYAGFIQRFAATSGACPSTTPTTGTTRLQKYSITATAAVTAPGAPTGVAATAGAAQASVAFTAPSSNGGSAITGYTASCLIGTTEATRKTVIGTISPILVTGLTNGSAYSCAVKATNRVGTGVASAAATVTPLAAPGAPTITSVTAGAAQITVAFTQSILGGTAASFTATCTASGVSKVATGTISPLVVAGLTVGTAHTCTVTASNGGGSSAASVSSSPATPTAVSTTVTYSTPANFASAIAKAYTPSTPLTAASTVTNRGYYMLSDAAIASTASNYAAIGTTYNATTGYTLASGTLTSSATYSDYLTKTMQLVIAADGFYRIDSYLHPNNSIDWGGSVSSPTLKFVNNFGKSSTTGNGFVTFEVTFDTMTKEATLRAKNRYTYLATAGTAVNGSTPYTGTYTKDSVFAGTGRYVKLSGSSYALSETATSFYIYATPLSLGIPAFMNPNTVGFVSNGAAPFLTKVTTSSIEGAAGISFLVKDAYKSQVATAGTNAATEAAAISMLASITASMVTCGEKLRYSTDVYLAYRKAALATKLVSDSIADGAPGQNLVPYVYFTNEQESSTKCHPFMVVVSYGNQASPNGLKDVPHPPGSSGATYENATVTRYSNLENYIFAIPMKDYGQVTDVTINAYPSSGTKNLWKDITSPWLTANVYTWADSADNGILIDGSVMFPAFNNGLVPSHLAGELSASGCHVGQGGGGPHCHADGYQSGQGLGLYNDADYDGKTHPPLLGFGYDGIALFARYRTTTDTAMLGYGTLDDLGAHNHNAIGYHYHAHTVSAYTSKDQQGASTTRDMYPLMKGAYIGNTNSIPFFRASSGFTTNKYLGGTVR